MRLRDRLHGLDASDRLGLWGLLAIGALASFFLLLSFLPRDLSRTIGIRFVELLFTIAVGVLLVIIFQLILSFIRRRPPHD